jgi:hypothetical protein
MDRLHGANLARSHHLVLVEQEDRDSSSIDEFVDLCSTGAKRCGSVAICRRGTDPVRLIQDQTIEAVLLSIDELG